MSYEMPFKSITCHKATATDLSQARYKFVDLDSNGVSRKQISLVINLKNNPDVVIFKSTRNEIRAEILK